MNEKKLGVVEDTLYVPMLGRIYASENCRNIRYDKKALELKKRMPDGMIENDTQTQYTYLASAARSANVDRYIADFIKRKPDGIIVQLGCGLETTCYRDDNGHTKWYGKAGLKLSTKVSMVVSDWFSMVRMIHLGL